MKQKELYKYDNEFTKYHFLHHQIWIELFLEVMEHLLVEVA